MESALYKNLSWEPLKNCNKKEKAFLVFSEM